MKLKDNQIIKIFVLSFLLMEFMLISFCFVSCENAPLLIRLIIILLVIICCLCLFYFIFRFLIWIIKKIVIVKNKLTR